MISKTFIIASGLPNAMETGLCWFGYGLHLRYLKLEAEEKLSRGITPLQDAVEGLDLITNKEFPLILLKKYL